MLSVANISIMLSVIVLNVVVLEVVAPQKLASNEIFSACLLVFYCSLGSKSIGLMQQIP